MMRNRPILSYCGLTVILSNQSRFDRVNLLSGPGGQLFNMFCLRPEFNTMQCDVRLTEDRSEFLPNTKCIILLGEAALWDWLPECRNSSLNEMRGSVFSVKGIPTIASFFAQDAADIKSHEQHLNKLSKEYVGDGDNDYEKDEDEDYDSVKKLGRTKRSNYAFWLRADVRKAKTIISGSGQPKTLQPIYSTDSPKCNAIATFITWMFFRA